MLLPIHAYPVVNKVDFPRVMAFGNCPLVEPATRSITLRCTIPVAFSFKLEVVRPHPYFSIQPQEGTIPANGSIDINVTFLPITLGSCTITLRLFIFFISSNIINLIQIQTSNRYLYPAVFVLFLTINNYSKSNSPFQFS